MFGFSSISEVPFSGFVAVGDVWNEIRNNSDQWIDLAVVVGDVWNEVTNNADTWRQIDPTNVGFLVLDSDGDEYRVSYTVLTNQGYVVISSVLNSSGQTFVPISESWQTASIGSNSWVEV